MPTPVGARHLALYGGPGRRANCQSSWWSLRCTGSCCIRSSAAWRQQPRQATTRLPRQRCTSNGLRQSHHTLKLAKLPRQQLPRTSPNALSPERLLRPQCRVHAWQNKRRLRAILCGHRHRPRSQRLCQAQRNRRRACGRRPRTAVHRPPPVPSPSPPAHCKLLCRPLRRHATTRMRPTSNCAAPPALAHAMRDWARNWQLPRKAIASRASTWAATWVCSARHSCWRQQRRETAPDKSKRSAHVYDLTASWPRFAARNRRLFPSGWPGSS